MIVKFFSARSKAKKYASGGDGVKNYLLGDDYENNKEPSREFAKHLSGDVDNVTEIINSLNFSMPYVSGCLSFDWDESERVTEPMKQDLMQKLEETLFPGMVDRVASYWVEHYDKLENEDDPNSRRRLELNFCFASVDLVTNKFLPVYYHAADVSRVNNYRDIANYEYDLSDPNDPKRQVSTRIPKSNPSSVKDIKSNIDEQILQGVTAGLLNNRDDIVNALQDKGYEILKQKPSSISIKNPDPEAKRNIRLEGAFFVEDFSGPKWLATYQSPIIEPNSDEFDRIKAEKAPEIDQKRAALALQMEKRSEFLSKRFPTPEPMATDNSILPNIPSERIQEYEQNFRSALASIATTRDSIIVKRNDSERILESAPTVQQYTDGTKQLAEGIDRTIEKCTQFTSKLNEADNIYRHEFQQDFERTKSGIAESERVLGDSKSIRSAIRNRAMSINIGTGNNLLSARDGQIETINRKIELRERKISESVARLNAPKPPTPFESKPEPKSYTKPELWKNPALRSPADLFRFRFNLLDNTTARLVPTRQNADQLYNDVLELPELMSKYHNLKNQQNFGIYDTYINFREIPLKWQRLDVLPEAKPILNFMITSLAKNDVQIMHDYKNSTTQDFLEKYAEDIKDLDKSAINSVIEHYASKHIEPREFAEVEPAPRVAREPELEQADRLRFRLRGL